ncbi:ArsA-related P-loop ATPase [Catenulispora pinisilvae]|uniref:ArsA-related P-loop ATPase n=1 Tax=Catenulispora pinisilvae TaxID=2705253 RepID=UPI0018923083|nr:ArsA-related P-loop ATPase [Catenulispora pinisilvae]
MSRPWPPECRLHIVTGKGGTGKTTAAAALALALAEGGGRVLLVEVEGRQGIAQLFDTAPLPYEERSIAIAPGGGEVFALAIDPEQALLEYLDMFYKLGRAGKALKRFGAIDFATTVAPGMRDVLLTGKACEAVRRTAADRPGAAFAYDAVVMDAPPTGRITRFLNVNTEVAGLARVGPVKNQAEAVMRVLTSPQTAVHLTTVLEDMPVQETLDGVEELRAAGLPVGAILVNMVRTAHLTIGKRAAVSTAAEKRVAALLRPYGIDTDETHALAVLGREHAERLTLEEVERRALDGAGQPVVELPQIGGGIDLGGLYELAAALSAAAAIGEAA